MSHQRSVSPGYVRLHQNSQIPQDNECKGGVCSQLTNAASRFFSRASDATSRKASDVAIRLNLMSPGPTPKSPLPSPPPPLTVNDKDILDRFLRPYFSPYVDDFTKEWIYPSDKTIESTRKLFAALDLERDVYKFLKNRLDLQDYKFIKLTLQQKMNGKMDENEIAAFRKAIAITDYKILMIENGVLVPRTTKEDREEEDKFNSRQAPNPFGPAFHRQRQISRGMKQKLDGGRSKRSKKYSKRSNRKGTKRSRRGTRRH
jgi:hypothetical protein